MEYDVLIIGGGHSGGMAAIFLRKLKFKGTICIIGDEDFMPYQRPSLSKDYLNGSLNQERLFLKKREYYKKNSITLNLEEKAIAIDKKKKEVKSNKQTVYRYKKLILATGSTVKKLPQNLDINSVFYLRNINDSNLLGSALDQKKSIGIIGSGYMGLEIAAIARGKGIETKIFELQNRILSRVTSEVTSNFFQKKHQKEGVEFFLNSNVSDINKYKNHLNIITDDGNSLNVEMIAVAIGIEPNIKIGLSAGITCKDGIKVDENCLTSDKDIFAIGDCSYHRNNMYSEMIRLESVQNAIDQAKTVASSIIGKPSPYNQVPWFWSDQYNLKLQIAGVLNGFDAFVVRGCIEDEKFTVFYLQNDYLIASDSVNNPSDFMLSKKMIKNKITIPKEILEDQNCDLKKYFSSIC